MISQLFKESDDLQDLIMLKNVCEKYKEHLEFIRVLVLAKEQHTPQFNNSLPPPPSIHLQCEFEKRMIMCLIESDRKLGIREADEVKAILVKKTKMNTYFSNSVFTIKYL